MPAAISTTASTDLRPSRTNSWTCRSAGTDTTATPMLLGASASTDGRPVGIHHATSFFRVPSALGMALAPPSTVQDDSPSSVWMRCRRFEPEDGRLRFRNHAPQEVIMFNELRRQVALHGVLGRAIVTRVPTGSAAQARRHLIPESDRGPPRPERQEPSKSHVFGSKRVW